MLDINFIRDNPEKVKRGVRDKGYDPNVVDRALKIDEERRQLISEIEKYRQERNKLAPLRQGSAEQGKKIKEMLRRLEPDLKAIEEELKELLWQIPNPPAPDVPIGKDERENEVIRTWGEPKKFSARGGPASGWDFKPKDHLELGELLDVIDVKRAGKVSGTRFGYLKNEGAILEFSLVQLAMETLVKEGFIPIVPPVFIKKETMRGMGYLEHGGEEEMYVFEKDNLVLVGTSEQSVGPIHMDEVLAGEKLPLRYAGFSTCFRRESGSYGKDTRGILRVHQFDKVEMFSFAKPDDSDKEHNFLLSMEEKLAQMLEIPYQVVEMCTGDLGAPAARKYDIECWLPSEGRYRETHSTSNCTDYQARRLNIRYKENNRTDFVHTLNGTAFAIGRMIIAILENYQQKDGSVLIPKVLQKYTCLAARRAGFAKISPK